MKNHKIFLIVVIFSVIINPNFGQKGIWTIGLNSGLRGEVMRNTEQNRQYKFGHQISTPSLELNCSYGLNDNFYLSIGVAYIEHHAIWMSKTFPAHYGVYESGYSSYRYLMYKSLQIPFIIIYDIPLFHSRCSFISKSGIVFDIPVSKLPIKFNPEISNAINYEGVDCMFTEFHTFYYNKKKINYLVNTSIGFAYHFKKGISLNLTGGYFFGLRLMEEVTVTERLTNKLTNAMIDKNKEYLLDYGDYWSVGLGVSYTFQKKRK